ncbi:MAG: chemotaxis protein CheC [Cellulosilyticaceae bacterium]
MSGTKDETRNQFQLDMLTEVGNIGAGNAVTALGKLLGKTVDMSIAKVRIEDIQELGNVLGDEEKYIAAMLIEVSGDVSGMLILALETESAKNLVNLLLQRTLGSAENFEELDLSVLCETGNILAGSYLSALGALLELEMTPSVPQMAVDMAASILSFPAIEFTMGDNSMLFIETKFTDREQLLNGTYILVLDNESFDKIIGALGKML